MARASRLPMMFALALSGGALAAPASAQDLTWAVNQCLNESKTFGYDQIIAGCTAIIQSGRLPPVQLSAVIEMRGNAYDEKADYTRAMADYNEAIRLNPQSATAFYNRAISLSRQDNERAALPDYNRAVALNPQLADGFLQRAYTNGKLGNLAAARADADRFDQLKPGDPRGAELRTWLAGQR